MIFGADRESRQDEDVFNLLDHSSTAQGATWFESCGRNDPLRAVNERFARKMRERGADINYTVTPGGHDWQSWRSAMPQLFTAAHLTLQ
jgi:enterochelin esterase-like enzyme